MPSRQSAKRCPENTNRVLLCCPSHAASDVLTRRLAGLLQQAEIFRCVDCALLNSVSSFSQPSPQKRPLFVGYMTPLGLPIRFRATSCRSPARFLARTSSLCRPPRCGLDFELLSVLASMRICSFWRKSQIRPSERNDSAFARSSCQTTIYLA